MKVKGVRLELVVVILIISLALFFGGQYYYTNYHLSNSLTESLLEIEGVEKVDVKKANKIKEVNLTLREVDNLKEVYYQSDKMLIDLLGEQEYKIKLNNFDNDRLTTAYSKLHLSIYESIMTGKFTELASQLNMLKNELDLTEAEVSVDENNIYLKLESDGNAFYKVIKRSYPNSRVALQGGGIDG
jgi:hypothetical protein